MITGHVLPEAAQRSRDVIAIFRVCVLKAGHVLRRALIVMLLALYPRMQLGLIRLRDRLQEIGAAATTTVVVSAIITAFGAAVLLPEAGKEERIAQAMAATPPLVVAEPLGLRGTGAAVASPVALTPEPGWVAVRKPIFVYNLEAPEVDGTDLVYSVMTGGKDARRDSLTWTQRGDRAAGMRPLVHLAVERHERGMPTFRPFFADLAARAAEHSHSIDRISATAETATKFGNLELAEALLATDRGIRPCLLFRRIDGFGFIIAGWYCGTGERPADRVSLACFIDRLDLVGAGQDRELKQYFARAERDRSKGCSTIRRPGRKMTWLDPEAPVPPLKLSAKGR